MINERGFYREMRKESNVDLSLVETEYATDNFIEGWQKQKERELENFSIWYTNNQNEIGSRWESIEIAVTSGIIKDSKLETIWKYRKEMFANISNHIIKLRDDIKENQEAILTRVAKRLAEYLPDWKPQCITILFSCNDSANFCIENSKITVDLARLAVEPAFFEKIEDGLVHELIHVWMNESRTQEYTERERIIQGIVGEGVATHIAKQDLKKHHEKNGVNFEDFRKKSFELFEKFSSSGDNDDLSSFKDVFLSMGEFYVVGNEITREVERKIGIEKFRKLLLEIKNNPEVLINEYKKII